MNLKERTYLWYIALLRIYVGYYMLQQGIRKFQRDFPRGDWIGRQIGDLATIDLYRGTRSFSLITWCRIKSCSVILSCLAKSLWVGVYSSAC